MLRNSHHNIKLVAVLGLVFLFFSCVVPLQQDATKLTPADPRRVASLFATLDKQNAGLKSFKAIGQINLKTGKKHLIMRAAWIGLLKDKLRIEILKPTGAPLISLSSDGSWAYLLLRADQKYYKRHLSRAGFGTWGNVAVPPADVVSLLSGRIPVRPYDHCFWETPSSEDGVFLHLTQRVRGTVQKILFDASRKKIRQVEVFQRDGTLIYKARWSHFRAYKDYLLPMRLEMINGEGDRLRLAVDKIWPNAAVKDSQFEIKEPAS
jgi:outer membrane lipoprotein-sorting protein